ncbi:hypothetical protein D3C81_1831370 [compost metagenome]
MKAICAAMTMANTPMIFCSSGPCSSEAVRPPSTLPPRMPTASQRTISQRTAPRLWWARIELIEVKAMVASEVPTARWVSTSGATPWAWKL